MEAHNLETTDPQAAAAIMDATAAQNVRCKKPVYHFVLSFDPKDAKQGKVPPEVMREIAHQAIDKMGLREHQLLIYAHKDTDHPHMHFLVNRIHPRTGKAFDRHNDGRKLTAMCRDIARERGLNIPLDREQERARIAEKERVDDFDLVETLKEQPPETVPEGEYWQAKKEDRPPQVAMDKAEVKALREKVQGHFYNAKDWHDLTARLGAQGVFLERKGQGLVLAKGDRFAKLSQMGKGVRLSELEDRLGERFDSFMAKRMQELAKEESPAANIPDYETMTPAERRRAERLRAAQQAVDRKRGDPVREFEAADLDYRYWAGVEAVYRSTERRISKHEREKAWLKKSAPNFEAREKKAKGTFTQSMLTIFRDPEKAQKRWKQLEAAYGIEDAQKMVRENPKLLGKMNGHRVLGMETPARKRAKRAFRYLDTKRKRWRETQLKHGNHRDRIEANRRALKIALNDFENMKHRTDVPFELKAIMKDKVLRRQKALTRVTERAILESDIAEDRKMDLLRAREIYMRRKRDRERYFEHNRVQGLDYLDWK
jgi:hypothetical protein